MMTTMLGDDISYIWKGEDGKAHAVNSEAGMFGIIKDVNAIDDPILWKLLHTEGLDIAYANILMLPDGRVFWMGSGDPVPMGGVNFDGEWHRGKLQLDREGKQVLTDKGEKVIVNPSHPNARFAMALENFPNIHPALHSPKGVPLHGILYGGRDYDTSVPVLQSFGWAHGTITCGACLESQTTSATIDKATGRNFDPMANRDFLSISIGQYVQNHLTFGKRLEEPPPIFLVNYYLWAKDRSQLGPNDSPFLNEKNDKEVWLQWIERRVHGDMGAIETPIGFIPKYEDLRSLFKVLRNKDYTRKMYDEQFQVRVQENLAKNKRMEEAYSKIPDAPEEVFAQLEAQKRRLRAAQKEFGDYIIPDKFE